VDNLAGVLALVAAHRFGRLQTMRPCSSLWVSRCRARQASAARGRYAGRPIILPSRSSGIALNRWRLLLKLAVDDLRGRLAPWLVETFQITHGPIVDRKNHRRTRNSNCSLEFCRPRFAHLARNVNNGEAPVNTCLFHIMVNITNVANVASLARAGMTPRCSPPRHCRRDRVAAGGSARASAA
jgi:hypothetical protein